MQWLGEVDVQAGSQLSLVAKHDTYSISFAWPESSTRVSTGQVTESTECTSSIARPAASEDGSRGASAGENSCKSSNPLDSARSIVDAHGTSDRLGHTNNDSAAGNSNQGSEDFPADVPSMDMQSQQEDVPPRAPGTKQARGVPLMVRCLLF